MWQFTKGYLVGCDFFPSLVGSTGESWMNLWGTPQRTGLLNSAQPETTPVGGDWNSHFMVVNTG